MAEKATIARPYARAAFDYARETGNFAEWSKMLAVGAAVAAHPDLEPLLGNPKVTPAQLVDVIVGAAAGVAANGGVAIDAPGRNFLSILAQNRRLALLPEIATQFETLRSEVENTLDVEVVSAMPIAAEQRERIVQALTARFGRQVRLRESIDESLVGGALVRAGDLVIDGTLRGRLERLQSQIARQ